MSLKEGMTWSGKLELVTTVLCIPTTSSLYGSKECLYCRHIILHYYFVYIVWSMRMLSIYQRIITTCLQHGPQKVEYNYLTHEKKTMFAIAHFCFSLSNRNEIIIFVVSAKIWNSISPSHWTKMPNIGVSVQCDKISSGFRCFRILLIMNSYFFGYIRSMIYCK